MASNSRSVIWAALIGLTVGALSGLGLPVLVVQAMLVLCAIVALGLAVFRTPHPSQPQAPPEHRHPEHKNPEHRNPVVQAPRHTAKNITPSSNVDVTDPYVPTVKPDRPPADRPQLRRENRFKVSPGTVRASLMIDRSWTPATVIDISRSGMRLSIPIEVTLPQQESLTLMIQLPGYADHPVVADIRWRNPSGDNLLIGLAFNAVRTPRYGAFTSTISTWTQGRSTRQAG